jgi:hypothetical protein
MYAGTKSSSSPWMKKMGSSYSLEDINNKLEFDINLDID